MTFIRWGETGSGTTDSVARADTQTAQAQADANLASIAALSAGNATDAEVASIASALQSQITAIDSDNATQAELDVAQANVQAQITAINADNATQVELDAINTALQTQLAVTALLHVEKSEKAIAADVLSAESGKWVDAELLNLEFQTRIKVVASLTINVPADQPTIQDALNQAALYISLDGKVVISIADGEYDLPDEIKQSSNQRVEIKAQNTVVPLRKAGYTNNKANDLVTAKSHHNVIINNTGTTSFLGGNSQLNIQFTGILFVCRDADNYVVYLRNNENAYFLDCTIFGGRLGISIYDNSSVRLFECTFLHQSIRSMYVWNGSTVNSDFTSFLYVPRGAYFVNGCRGYLLRSEFDAGVAGTFCQHNSALYIRGGDHVAGSYNFYSTNGSTTYVLTSATIQGSFTAGLIGYAYYNSTMQLQGAVADFDMTGVSGTYVARALHNSHLLLSVGVNAKTARLDHSSSGVSSTATCIFSPAKTIVGNNNSLWI